MTPDELGARLSAKVAAIPVKALAAMNEKAFAKFNNPKDRAKLRELYGKLTNPDVRASFLKAGGGKMADLIKP